MAKNARAVSLIPVQLCIVALLCFILQQLWINFYAYLHFMIQKTLIYESVYFSQHGNFFPPKNANVLSNSEGYNGGIVSPTALTLLHITWRLILSIFISS